MERKFLENFGLDTDVIEQIMKEANTGGEEVEELRKQLSSKEEELKAKDLEIESLNEKQENSEKLINTLKNKTKDDESSQKLIENYKNQIEQIQAQALKDRIHSRVILELVEQGCTDPELVSFLIKDENIQVNKDGSFSGITEQVQLLKNDEKRGSYFKSDEPIPQPERGGYPPESTSNYANYFDDIQSKQTAEDNLGDPILNILRERDSKAYTEKGDPNKYWDSLA